MPSRPHVHLMLPSPLGLLEYDVLEDAVFLGPGPKGNLRAGPSPFKGALVALTKGEAGFVAKPLPGVEAPLINGEAVAEKVLDDGDRIRIGDQTAMFRTGRGTVQAAPAPKAVEPKSVERAPAPRERRNARSGSNPAVTITVLVGLAIVLAATYRAVSHLKTIQGARSATNEFPELKQPVPPPETRPAKELATLRAAEARDPNGTQGVIARYRAFARAFEGTPEAESAQERIREIMERWSVDARAKLDADVERLIGAHQFARALKEIRDFEKRFGTTEAAKGTDTMRQSVRMAARTALDALVAKVGPLITPKPREAHRMLIGVSHEFPADMASETVELLERCVARMMAMSAERRKRQPRAPPPANGGNARKQPDAGTPNRGGASQGDPGLPELPNPGDDDADEEAQARDAWAAAHAALQGGNYPEAVQGYTMLIQQHGNTQLYRRNKSKITAGRRAAKVGALGPQGLVNVPAKVKKGRLELEYTFNDQRVFDEDFTAEQPFSSEMPVQVKWRRGAVMMEKASGLFHRLVFLPDVLIEADIEVQQPHDFGLIAVEESDEYRAILFNIANTKFKLKKGDAARVNPGHLIWYIGQGVWSAADKDAHGFIKIAEKNRSKLEGGDRLKLELRRKKDKAEASFQGKTDGVHLEGAVKGDNGSTMGPGRVGLFTNSGIIVVKSVKISGVVDMEWFRKELAFLVASDPGPGSSDDE